MVRHTDEADAESLPQYAAAVDLSTVDAGDTIDFKTNASLRDNGVTVSKTLTVDTVDTVTETTTRMVDVDPAWFPDTGPFGSPDDVVSKSVPRETTQTKTTVVAIDQTPRVPYRYKLTQIDDDEVRVSSCKLEDFEDQQNGTWNAVARSNVSNGYVTDFDVDTEPVAVTDGGRDVTEYDTVVEDDDAPYDQIAKGDAVDVVYVPNRGKAPSKTKSGIVTHVARDADGDVRTVNVDTGDEYDDGTPKTFEVDRYNRIVSHGRVRETTIGDVTRVVVRTYADVDTDDDETDRDVSLPAEGAEYVDTVRDERFVVDTVTDDDRVESHLITWEDGTASTEEEYVDDRRTGRLVPADDPVDVPIADGGTSVDDFETTKADVADAVRDADDRTLWEAFAHETQRRVTDVEVGEYAAVAYTLSVDAYAGGADLSRCVVPAVVWGVTDKAYAYDRLGDVYDAVVVFDTRADGPYVDETRKKVADAIDPAVVVTEPIADPNRDGEPVTDGGRDVEAVTVYVIDGAHETTSAAKAERARERGKTVTAKSRLR